MKICENCGNLHDGQYGSGRFCSLHCRKSWIGKQSYKKRIEQGTFFSPLSKGRHPRAEHGRWTCRYCGLVFETKHLLWDHYHSCHAELLGNPHNKDGKSWNRGLTKETNNTVKESGEKLHIKYMSGELRPGMLGKKHTEETKRKISEIKLKATYHRKCKKTLPYKCLDGTIVNLDSSYERKLANIFD